MASNRKYDAIIYGASGFTGQYVVQEFASVQHCNKNKPLKWAIAGRTRAKLNQVLENAAKATGLLHVF